MTLIVLVIVFLARILYPIYYSSRAFIQIGLFNDKICYVGSYEMIVCPYSAPPFETFIVIFVILFVIFRVAERKTPTEPSVSSNAEVRKSKT